eukprot:CAMPEP_0202972252 /NCGR_PEP_ID=MMETSP1396-20130829/34771_1 /ASSEMBLY_ACC=CAM_ASM_000872 /TAXON_ID= /ORGANISM="Pseudokeronopsis sp., Strain Brazil" /LENGTH=71 /DNA_ID=CAMNT_0049702467 /DNA_START=1098 /DNA_END=1309 /DNA_ORIENTATION=+
MISMCIIDFMCQCITSFVQYTYIYGIILMTQNSVIFSVFSDYKIFNMAICLCCLVTIIYLGFTGGNRLKFA